MLHQYPACGFNIDLIAERSDDHVRVAVECDGERYHVDEHGMLKIEDIERQAILERAGWRVVRIPYRKWIANPSLEVTRVLAAIDEIPAEDDETDGEADASTATINSARALSGGVVPGTAGKREQVTHEQAALIEALKEGLSEEVDLFLRVRDLVGSKRLTQRLRRAFESAASDLARRKLLTIEDGEWFLLPAGREATLSVDPLPLGRPDVARDDSDGLGYR